MPLKKVGKSLRGSTVCFLLSLAFLMLVSHDDVSHEAGQRKQEEEKKREREGNKEKETGEKTIIYCAA